MRFLLNIDTNYKYKRNDFICKTLKGANKYINNYM